MRQVYAKLFRRYVNDRIACFTLDIDHLNLIIHLPAEIVELKEVDRRPDIGCGWNEWPNPSIDPTRAGASDGCHGFAVQCLIVVKILDRDGSHVASPIEVKTPSPADGRGEQSIDYMYSREMPYNHAPLSLLLVLSLVAV
jgi:hypothetical protein